MSDLLTYVAVALLVLVWFRVERSSSQISGLRDQVASLRRELGLAPALTDEPSERVRQLAKDPKTTIEAIKTYREESGADLKAAKAVVERLRSASGDA